MVVLLGDAKLSSIEPAIPLLDAYFAQHPNTRLYGQENALLVEDGQRLQPLPSFFDSGSFSLYAGSWGYFFYHEYDAQAIYVPRAGKVPDLDADLAKDREIFQPTLDIQTLKTTVEGMATRMPCGVWVQDVEPASQHQALEQEHMRQALPEGFYETYLAHESPWALWKSPQQMIFWPPPGYMLTLSPLWVFEI